MSIAVLYREELKEYDFGPGHPFRGDRYPMFYEFLREQVPEDDSYRVIKADWATDQDLGLICRDDYITFTREYFKAANLGQEFYGNFHHFHSGDNVPIGPPGKIEEAARYVVGQAKKAADLLQGGEFQKAVCIGGGLHHAKPSYGEGFCIYNDVAFCARHLMAVHDLERVLVLDTDAHAGNGTAEYFYDDPHVLLIDIHQDPRMLYPGTGFPHQIGAEEGKGFTVNIPVPLHAGYKSYSLIFDQIVEPIVHEFKPQIIIRNGGSDPHYADILTNLGLTVEGFKIVGDRVRQLSEICDGKVVDLIASGYNRDILPYAWLALIAGLAGWQTEIEEPAASPQKDMEVHFFSKTESMIEDVKANLKDYWSCLR
jgi:acetoin utilization protein AcuC